MSDEVKARLKSGGYLAQYLDETRGTHIGGSAEKQIPCPNRAAHAHGDANPSARYYRSGGDEHVHCHGCGGHWDIFDLAALDRGFTFPAQFSEAVRFLAEKYGLSEDLPTRTRPAACAPLASSPTNAQPEAVAQYLSRCLAHYGETDYLARRGISSGVAARFRIGYDPDERRVVFPQGAGYVARAVDNPLPDKVLRYKYPKGCGVTPFNLDALWNEDGRPVFIVEGQIDALSVIEAGGLAVGLGGITHGKSLIAAVRARPVSVPVCVSFDADGQTLTRQKERELSKSLEAAGVRTFAARLYPDGCKDANDALLRSRADLAAEIRRAELDAKGSEAANLPEFFTFADLPDEEEPEKDNPRALIKNGYFRKGHGLMVVSTSGAGKSVFAIQLALALAKGSPIFGLEPLRPLKVGVIQAEDDREELIYFKRNMKRGFAAEHGWSDADFAKAAAGVKFERVVGKTGADFIERLREIQRNRRYDVVIVNPLFSYFGGDLSNNRDDDEFFRKGIDPLIKDPVNGFGIVFIHHANKPPKGQDRKGWGTDTFAQYIGAGGTDVAGWTRAQLVLMPIDGHFGWAYLIGAKREGRLGWRDGEGEKTRRRIIAHGRNGVVFWRDPSPEEIPADIKTSAAKAASPSEMGQEEAERRIVAKVRTSPQHRGIAKTELFKWCVDTFTGMKSKGGSPCKFAYDNVTNNPDLFGLETFKEGRTLYYRAKPPELQIGGEPTRDGSLGAEAEAEAEEYDMDSDPGYEAGGDEYGPL